MSTTPHIRLVKTDRTFPTSTDAPIGRTSENVLYVLCHGRLMDRRDVPLGHEFIENGKSYQTSIQRVRYSTVETGRRFRRRDVWLVKTAHGEHPLRPNMPLGDVDTSETQYRISANDSVDLLIVIARG